MAKKTEKEVLEVGVDVQKALHDMTKLERATKRNFADVAKAVDKLNKVNKTATKGAKKGTEEWQASIEDLTKTYKDTGREIEKYLDTIEILQRKAAAQSGEEQKNTLDQIKNLKKLGAEKIKALHGREKKEGRVMADNMFKESAKELGDTLKETLSAVFESRDVKKALEGSAKSLVKGLKLSSAAGLKLGNVGTGLHARGKERGGMAGGLMQAGGMGMKGVGAMMGGIKPLVDMLTKLGPILGAIGGAVVGIVKLFLDADAKVKDFNKEILASSGNVDFLTRSAGNTNVAFNNMSDTLDGVWKAATAFDNINLGITPDDYKAIINALGQEGASLGRIGSEAAHAGKSVEAFTSDLAHVSVAYSRAFGVPLQEINTLQAEMMTEMGSSLDDTTLAFQQMTKAAEDSGISANKFFGMIRGVSQDLSLWGTRMEDAVKLLGRLGQVMNPRNAQKFMQTAAQGLKNMGRTERLRLSLLTGQGKMGKLVDRDIKRKADGLAKSFGMTGEEVMKKISSKDGRGELEGKIQKMDPSQQGALREALIDAQLQAERRKKGTFGTATAARTLGPAAALEAMQGALVKFGGGKKLSDIVGTIGGEMMAENLGISEEQMDQMAHFEASIDNQREVLKKQLMEGTEAQKQAARDALKQAGVQGKDDKDLAKNVDEAGYDQIMDTLSDGDKLEAQGASKAEIMSQHQADLQTSMLSKLQAILDWLMNQLYNVLNGIWDTILDFPFVGGDAKRKRKLGGGLTADLEKVLTSQDPAKAMSQSDSWKEMMASLKSAAGDPARQKQFQDAMTAMADKIGGPRMADAAKMAGIDPKKISAAMENLPELVIDKYTGKVSQNSEDARNSAMAKNMLKLFTPDELTKVMEKATVWTGSAMDKVEGVAAGRQALGLSVPPPSAGGGAAVKPAGGGPAATPTAPPESPAVKDTAVAAQDNLSLTKDQLGTMQSIDSQMDKFKMDTSFLSGPYSKAIEGSVLKAVRTALFEYYMYKDLDQSSVLGAMRNNGLTPGTIGSTLVDHSLRSGLAAQDTVSTLGKAPANASGGLVTGVDGGMAMITAAAGEGLASVGRGEQIMPRGGGGMPPVSVTVNGVGGNDLARIIETKVIDGIHEYKRKERFH